MKKVNFQKEVRGINTYRNVIDVDFKELIKTEKPTQERTLDIFDLFRLYDSLFYDIPIEGIYSHTTLIEKSSQYVGSNVIDLEKQALIEEINALKQQIIDLSETYLTIGSITK